MTRSILLVDSERDVFDRLDSGLRAEHAFVVVVTGAAALEELGRRSFDLVMLDLALPDMPGNELCRRIRNSATTHALPLLLMSSQGAEIDRVVGLELGADDYVVKPFSPRELSLRVRAILRRALPPSEDVITIGAVVIDLEAHRVTVEGRDAQLTLREFRLFHDLVLRRGRIQSRGTLLDRIWGHGEPRTVDTHVKRLRTKLGNRRDLIETVRGIGYRVRSDE